MGYNSFLYSGNERDYIQTTILDVTPDPLVPDEHNLNPPSRIRAYCIYFVRHSCTQYRVHANPLYSGKSITPTLITPPRKSTQLIISRLRITPNHSVDISNNYIKNSSNINILIRVQSKRRRHAPYIHPMCPNLHSIPPQRSTK